MKKSKIIAIILIIAVMLTGIAYNVFGADAITYRKNEYKNDKREKLTLENKNGQYIGYNKIADYYNNVYGLEYGKKFPVHTSRPLHDLKVKVEINGNTAKFYTYENGKWKHSKDVVTTENNVLGAILTDGKIDGKTGVRFEEYETGDKVTYTTGHRLMPDSVNEKNKWVYTDAQLALYEYWEDWVAKVDGEQYGFSTNYNSLKGNELNWAHQMINQAKTKAMKYTYNVTIYQLSSYYKSTSYQDIIVTEFKDPTSEGNINISVNTEWNDGNNQDGKRPDSIEVQLLKEENGKEEFVQKATISSKENKVLFTNLPKTDNVGTEIQYTIGEISIPGYTSKYTREENGQKFTITNIYTPETTEVVATKEWKDNYNEEGTRPEVAKLTLYADGKEVETADVKGTGDSWNYTFAGLPKYRNGGIQIAYTVDEKKDNIADGYIKTVSGTTIASTRIANAADAFIGDESQFEAHLNTLTGAVAGVNVEDIPKSEKEGLLLGALDYLGVKASWLKEKGLLYTDASTIKGFTTNGGAGKTVPRKRFFIPC